MGLLSVWFPGEYRWIDSARFRIGGTAPTPSTHDVLSALLRHDHYVDAYQFADKTAGHVDGGRNIRNSRHLPDDDGRPEHGSYYMSRINVDTFDELSGPEGRRALEEWVDSGVSVPPRRSRIQGDLPSILQALAAAPAVYRLQDLGDAAWQPAGFVLDEPYLELVAIDLPNRSLHLVAAGGD